MAIVRAYLPIYKEGWGNPPAEEPDLKAMTCIIDCRKCGVRNQVLPMDAE